MKTYLALLDFLWSIAAGWATAWLWVRWRRALKRIRAVLAYLDEASTPCQFGVTGECTHGHTIDPDQIRDLIKED